ncbi:hypothetical protein SOJ65_18445 [Pseudomonas aeruginosa]|uniref:hypothetical protein n=1 Tax=Pseudomonas aeruginosa TaxID=287 RepID=UPI0012AC718E|nr:hypothetical protein [Pseudomonas aeruginosa]MBK1501262.1 hypothetical protein [Pseudomonas aeruginosa]MCV0233363.1 hypothetical protein [Pseudomonas aeruginosa]MCW3885917.1 hypothetical protein [Pseudomonas aeruginosa]MDY1053048.1 hypothetical protein [Pseudomonas aeruginosa]HBN8547847.1 hypothetical protein [Pseudomonas aeruginosa]
MDEQMDSSKYTLSTIVNERIKSSQLWEEFTLIAYQHERQLEKVRQQLTLHHIVEAQ